MLSIKKATSGYQHYFIQQVSTKYYTEGGERPGQWFGSGAARLGLTGEVDPRNLVNVTGGMKPDGSGQLIELNSIRHDQKHIAMYDLCWSPPKDVSLLWGLYPDLKPKIEQMHEKAVTEGLRYAQEHAAFTRRGAGGKRLEPGELVVATFVHGTNRNGEPQLHTHTLVMNAVARADDGFGTIVSKFLYDHQIAMRRVYSTTLAIDLQRELGAKVVFADAKPHEPGDRFRIAGIPDRLRDLMSSRRAEVLAEKARLGLTSAKGGEIAALASRNDKTHLPEEFLRQKWTQIAQKSGFDLEELRKAVLVRQAAQSKHASIDRIPAESINAEHKSDTATPASHKVTSMDSRRAARRESASQADSGSDTTEPVQTQQTPQRNSRLIDQGMYGRAEASMLEAITKSALTERLPDRAVDGLIDIVLEQFDKKNPAGRFANREELAAEAKKALPKLLATAQELQKDARHAIAPDDVSTGFGGPITTQPGDAALVEVLKRGALVCVQSTPGADEASLVKALVREYSDHGKRVQVLTTGTAAANQLETLAGVPTYTVHQHLSRMNMPKLDVAKHHAMQILKAAMQRQTDQLDQWKLDRDSVLMVTQSQMLRTQEMATIVSRAHAAGAKVILCGDGNQIARREPHNAFTAVCSVTGTVKMPEPTKQSEAWMSDAARQAANGDVRGALSQYALAERLHLHRDHRAAAAAAVDHWKRLSRSDQDRGTLLIASGPRDTHLLNRLAQNARRQSNAIPNLMWQRVRNDWVYRGDRIQFHISSKHYGFKAGDFGTIQRINLSSMTLKLDRTTSFLKIQRQIRVDVPKSLYRGLSLGYAVDASQAQGLTCERALVLPRSVGHDPRGMAAQLGCARTETHLFTTPRVVGEDVEAIHSVLTRELHADRMQMQAQVKNPTTSRTSSVEEPREHARRQAHGVRI